MRVIILLFLALCIYTNSSAQNDIIISIKDRDTKELLQGVTCSIKNTEIVKVTNNKGVALFVNIENGKSLFQFTCVGYITLIDSILLPQKNDTFFIYMDKETIEEEEVIVQSTRTSRTIKNTPTRVETIDGEELDEKNNMRPSNVSMLLHESTGLQVQQTSATTGNASIRVQGLDGRYTQLLKDGYPNFGNFASGLSILEIPPLDLKQVEIIKGPASTLYGGGAIAGVVNFISKTPKEKLNGDFILNQSNIGQSNIAAYISKRNQLVGFSFLGAYNRISAYDVDKDGFSELPKGDNFTLHPKIFIYPNNRTTIQLGSSFTKSTSTGGDMEVIKRNTTINNVYFEKNTTLRNTTTLELNYKVNEHKNLKLKQSISIFDRTIAIPAYIFSGKNTNSFSDLSFILDKEKHTLITGINFMVDQFKQKQHSNNLDQSIKTITTGTYVQHTWDVSDYIKLENGLRIDGATYKNGNLNNTEVFVLPRITALVKWNANWSTRIGGGLGYKTPTIFTEQTESMQYQMINALQSVKSERSVGGTIDFNFKKDINENFNFSGNQLFFITRINNPLILTNTGTNSFFINATKPYTSNGFETNLKFIYKENLKLFVGYTLTNAKATFLSTNQFLILLPKHKVNLTMMYEKEDNFKFGLEGYYTDQQFLSNGNRSPAFWEFGFMAQKTFGKFSFFINFENFTDERQSKYKRVVNIPNNNPTFDEIWNHTEGRAINGGVKIKL
jgi:outer membrane receptor for ferrienterochelin and colicins